jgi:hypothetical protein
MSLGTTPLFHAQKEPRFVAYVRRKTVKGKTYCYLVKSVREGKRVRQVFVSYIGNPPPAASRPFRDEGAQAPNPPLSVLPDFTPLVGPDVSDRYVGLLHLSGQNMHTALRWWYFSSSILC